MPAKMIDTHAHLSWSTYEGQVAEVVERSVNAGVTRIINVGIDLASSEKACHHAETYEAVYFSAGIHPSDAGEAGESDLEKIEELCKHPKCIAVGEIGLDFFRDFTNPDTQEKYLRKQLELALRLNKPVILHDRKASKKLLEVLEECEYDGNNGPGGVFHCFAGDSKMTEEVLKRGFYISFTGNLTYKKSDRPEVALAVPLDRLLLETDSPFMAPVPHRGRNNEPSFVPYIAAAHAALRKTSIDEVAEQTTANAVKLFGINPDRSR